MPTNVQSTFRLGRKRPLSGTSSSLVSQRQLRVVFWILAAGTTLFVLRYQLETLEYLTERGTIQQQQQQQKESKSSISRPVTNTALDAMDSEGHRRRSAISSVEELRQRFGIIWVTSLPKSGTTNIHEYFRCGAERLSKPSDNHNDIDKVPIVSAHHTSAKTSDCRTRQAQHSQIQCNSRRIWDYCLANHHEQQQQQSTTTIQQNQSSTTTPVSNLMEHQCYSLVEHCNKLQEQNSTISCHRWLSDCTYDNVQQGRPLFDSCSNDHEEFVFSDTGYEDPQYCYHPTLSLAALHAFVRKQASPPHKTTTMTRTLPKPLILHIRRNATKWANSVQRHWSGHMWESWKTCQTPNDDQERVVQSWDFAQSIDRTAIPKFPLTNTSTTQDLIDLYLSHTELIRKYARYHASHIDFVEVELESDSVGSQLEHVFGIPRDCWGHANCRKNCQTNKNK